MILRLRSTSVVTCMFVSITFIAGIYGMNFEHMPELTSRYANFSVLGDMVIVVVGLLYFFRRRQWF